MSEDKQIAQIELHRNLLYVLAEAQLDHKLRSKIDPADIVQETMCLAYARYDSITDPDNGPAVKGWLITILGNVLIDQRRRFYAEKRDANLERAISDSIDASRTAIESWLEACQTSPSMAMAKNEQLDQLTDAIRMLPDDMREVVIRRHINGEAIFLIATSTGRTTASVAGLLRRGMAKLRQHLAASNSSLFL